MAFTVVKESTLGAANEDSTSWIDHQVVSLSLLKIGWLCNLLLFFFSPMQIAKQQCGRNRALFYKFILEVKQFSVGLEWSKVSICPYLSSRKFTADNNLVRFILQRLPSPFYNCFCFRHNHTCPPPPPPPSMKLNITQFSQNPSSVLPHLPYSSLKGEKKNCGSFLHTSNHTLR